jgi:hypothetical protein
MAFGMSHDLARAAPAVARPGGRVAVHGLAVAPRRRASTPCLRWCVECGHLTDPASVSASAYRDDAPPPTTGACSECGALAVADLGAESVTDELHGHDDRLPVRIRPVLGYLRYAGLVVTSLVTAGIGTVGGAVFATGMYFGWQGGMWSKSAAGIGYVAAFLGLFCTYALVAYLLPALRQTPGRTRKTPLRWLGAVARDVPALAGAVELADDAVALHAPLSGRTCAAWEVAIRKDDRVDAEAGTWLLVERRNAPLRIADGTVARDALHAPLRRELVDVDPTDPRVAEYLRARGLDPTGLTLVMYEALVPCA